jgi:hypothetical protein
MGNFIRFRKEKSFSEVQGLFMGQLAEKSAKCFIGNKQEIANGQQRSFYPYCKLHDKVNVLPYFFDGDCAIELCIDMKSRYAAGSIIPANMKIVGICTNSGRNGISEMADRIVRLLTA